MTAAALRECGAMAGGQSWAEDLGQPSSGGVWCSGASTEGQDEDFLRQMDENGIIGLNWASPKEAGLELDESEDEEGGSASHQHLLQNHSLRLSELQDFQTPGGNSYPLSLCELDEQASSGQVREEDQNWMIRRLLVRDRQCDMTKVVEEEEEEKEDITSPEEFSGLFGEAVELMDRLQLTEAPEYVQAGEGGSGLAGGHHGHQCAEDAAAEQTSRGLPVESHEESLLRNSLPPQPSCPPLSALPPAGGAQCCLGSLNGTLVHPCPTKYLELESNACSKSKSVIETHGTSHCGQRDHGQGDAVSPDSEKEEFVDRSSSTPTSRSLQPRTAHSRRTRQAELEMEGSSVSPLVQASKTMPSALQCTRKAWQSSSDLTPSGLRTSKGKSPKRRHSQDVCRFGKGHLNHPLPDFSKVEPRVRFPKEDYKPPKSKGLPGRKGRGSEKPLVFKSPADIVREVLSCANAPPSSVALSTPAGPRGPLSETVPQEFCSPQQATALVHQLQEDYHRLLTKCAEAENTIDRLRLEAKVNLYSDPPKPCHPDCTATLSMGSKDPAITLPHSQRGELDLIAVSKGTFPEEEKTMRRGYSSTSARTSASMTRSLGPRLGECLTEALSRQVRRYQMQVDSFEELLRGRKLKPLELVQEGLSCLAEGQGSLERGYLRAREEHRLLQQLGGDPGPFDPHRELEGAIFSTGMRLEALKEQVELQAQVQPVSTAPPLTPAGADLTVDLSTTAVSCPHPESLLLPPGGGARKLIDMLGSSAGVESEGEGEGEGETDGEWPSTLPWLRYIRHQHGEKDLSPLPLQKPDRTEQSVLSPSPTSSLQEPFPEGPLFPRQQSQDRGWSGVESNSGSPAREERNVLEDRLSSIRTAPLQDRILSPATDSGFVGSQSSNLNLAASSPAQQGAKLSQSSPLEWGGDKNQQISAQSGLCKAYQKLTSSDCCRAVASDPEVLSSGQKSRMSSPGHWLCISTSEFDSESDHSHSSSEHEEGSHIVHVSQSANRMQRHQRRTTCHDGNPSDILGPGRLKEPLQALKSLQAEMNRLEEQLERNLQLRKLSYPITVPPVVQEVPLRSQHCSAAYPSFTPYPEKERSADGEEDDAEETQAEEVEGDEEAPSTVSPVSQPTAKPQSTRRFPESSGAHRRRQQRWGRVEGKTEHRWPHTGQHYSLEQSDAADDVRHRQRQGCARSDRTPHDLNMNYRKARTAAAGPSSEYRRYQQSHCRHRTHAGQAAGGLSMRRTSGSAPQNTQPLGFSHRKDEGVFLPAPTPPVLGFVPVVQCVPVCPSVLYYTRPSEAPPPNLQLFHQSLDGRGPGLRWHTRAPPADRESLSDSLTRAIDAARRMKAVSGHMARSLSAGIRHQGVLSLT
ncbi:hypothetical protein GJAV_G00029820 [Gymnothorax javanicus]|nr:hypothetical protein GJAV_G00029820 [Gymnothorax javanicus]